ncbi:MAG: response regulator [Candidatus Saganbacteria bacterium]|nr:response regulator [Candidatus Saganbacteria bacterium]
MTKILLIDDETEFAEMTAFQLAKAGGYQVVTAFDGEAGLRQAAAEPPDLIILDLWLPKKNGYEVLAELKKTPATSRIPVIFLTASAAPATLEKMAAAGAAGHLLKPFEASSLMEKIKQCLTT